MKKLALIAAALLSSATFATSSTTAKMFPIPYVHNGQSFTTSSYHTYTVRNDTSTVQAINVCYTITTCPEWQYYVKSTTLCDHFNLNSGESKSGIHNVDFPINYPFTGWCHAIAKTELTGGSYSLATNETQFEVGR